VIIHREILFLVFRQPSANIPLAHPKITTIMTPGIIGLYMARFTVIIEKDDDDWLVSEVTELPGCHTQAKTMDELLAKTKEAIQGYLEDEAPPYIPYQFVGLHYIQI
jgi:predicted RNase H-like HicB family nuclease